MRRKDECQYHCGFTDIQIEAFDDGTAYDMFREELSGLSICNHEFK
ncbi:hypothetical protein ABXT08_05030 [Chryseobacterium sp. NRRL B-14859]|jgi:hypothetical protein